MCKCQLLSLKKAKYSRSFCHTWKSKRKILNGCIWREYKAWSVFGQVNRSSHLQKQTLLQAVFTAPWFKLGLIYCNCHVFVVVVVVVFNPKAHWNQPKLWILSYSFSSSFNQKCRTYHDSPFHDMCNWMLKCINLYINETFRILALFSALELWSCGKKI